MVRGASQPVFQQAESFVRRCWLQATRGAARMGLALFLSCLAATAAQAADPAAEAYKLRPGDEISLSVSPQRSYDCTGVLLPDGMLYLKNVGAMRAAGL